MAAYNTIRRSLVLLVAATSVGCSQYHGFRSTHAPSEAGWSKSGPSSIPAVEVRPEVQTASSVTPTAPQNPAQAVPQNPPTVLLETPRTEAAFVESRTQLVPVATPTVQPPPAPVAITQPSKDDTANWSSPFFPVATPETKTPKQTSTSNSSPALTPVEGTDYPTPTVLPPSPMPPAQTPAPSSIPNQLPAPAPGPAVNSGPPFRAVPPNSSAPRTKVTSPQAQPAPAASNGPSGQIASGAAPQAFDPHTRILPTATGGRLDLAPGEMPASRVVELSRQLEIAAAQNRELQAKIRELEAQGTAREQSLSEAIREAESAALEVSKTRIVLQSQQADIAALRAKLKKIEAEDIETFKAVITALEKLSKAPSPPRREP